MQNENDLYGWISIARSIQKHWIAKDKPYCQLAAWVDLIVMAKHKDEFFETKRKILVSGKRGCVYRSTRDLAERWGWSRKKVSTFLRKLEKDSMIEIVENSTTNGTTIFIVNYDIFQHNGTTKRATEEPQRSHRGATKEPQRNIYNNNNNITTKQEKKKDMPAAHSFSEPKAEEENIFDDYEMTEEEEAEFMRRREVLLNGGTL